MYEMLFCLSKNPEAVFLHSQSQYLFKSVKLNNSILYKFNPEGTKIWIGICFFRVTIFYKTTDQQEAAHTGSIQIGLIFHTILQLLHFRF